MRFWLRLLIFFIAWTGVSWAAPLPVRDGQATYLLAPYLEVLEDAEGRLGIDDVRKAEAAFVPHTGSDDLSFGYRRGAVWVRMTLVPPAGGSRYDWLLELPYPTLDSVVLYRPDEGGDRATATGDLTPFASRPLNHRNFVFPVSLKDGSPQTYYLRVESEGSLTVPLALWRSDAFARHSELGYAGLSLYFGAFLALALYNLMLYFALRDRLFLIYVAFVASMAIGLAGQYGLAYQFLWPQSPWLGNLAFPGGMTLSGIFAALFTRGFLDTQRLQPRFDLLLKFMATAFLLVLAILPFHYRWAAWGISLGGALFSTVALFAGVRSVSRRYHGAIYYLLAWTLLLLFSGLMSLRNMGLMPSNFVTLNGMQIGSVMEMILLSFALADRYRQAQREHERAREEALKTKQQMLDSLRSHERMLEQRVVERTTELRQANTKLQENEKKLREMAHHDPLTGLANRLLFDLRLEHALKTSARNDTHAAVLLLDLDDFKPVNDHYGHAVGDELLVTLARRMEAAVRQTDTVARLGGDEFIILLEAVSGPEAVAPIVDKLVETLHAPVQTSTGIAIQVSVSIGYTVAQPGETDRNTLINRADHSMYQAKNTGGNQACLASL